MSDFFFENCNFSSDVKLDLIAKGKVRDIYDVRDKHKILLIASDRASAFDYNICELDGKGTVLTELAGYWFKKLSNIAENHYIDHYKNYMLVKKCNPIKLEFIVRGYITGSCWKKYSNGERLFCGVILEEGLVKNQQFSKPIITPTTKADFGHDEDISRDEILKQGLVSEEDYLQLENYTKAIFQRGTEMANERGLILVDTKYEFGKKNDKIFLIDEIHTPDSSRYFYKDGYQERQNNGDSQKQLSKEFVREWLMENGFQGKDGQQIPEMNKDFVDSVSKRYIELYENVSGLKFVKGYNQDPMERIKSNVNDFFK